jgi:hypothetical protein
MSRERGTDATGVGRGNTGATAGKSARFTISSAGLRTCRHRFHLRKVYDFKFAITDLQQFLLLEFDNSRLMLSKVSPR